MAVLEQIRSFFGSANSNRVRKERAELKKLAGRVPQLRAERDKVASIATETKQRADRGEVANRAAEIEQERLASVSRELQAALNGETRLASPDLCVDPELLMKYRGLQKRKKDSSRIIELQDRLTALKVTRTRHASELEAHRTKWDKRELERRQRDLDETDFELAEIEGELAAAKESLDRLFTELEECRAAMRDA